MIAPTASLTEIAEHIGATVAGPAAESVDREARFPAEAVAAYREHGLLSALVPVELGGRGASLAQVADAVRILANHCSASALVFAMHNIDAFNLVRVGTTEPLRQLQRELATEQLLFANANSEVGYGGDVARSGCGIETVDGRATLTKDCLAISYGEYADVLFATARRSVDAEAADQVQVICRGAELTPLNEWDSIGLRGTCSRGFHLVCDIDPELIYPVPWSEVAAGGGIQGNMFLLSSVWVGIAEAAAGRAHASVRSAARKQIGTTPRSATRLAELVVKLDEARGLLDSVGSRLAIALADAAPEDPALLAQLRNLKISSSEHAVAIATAALEICGIAGYRRDTPVSLDRQVRDALGGLVMVSNDRYRDANAETLIVRKRL